MGTKVIHPRAYRSKHDQASVRSAIVVAIGVRAETIRVPEDYASIQGGINASSSGDTVLVSPGTYTGQGNVTLDYARREILLISENGPEATVIDCEYKDQTAGVVFRTSEGPGARLSGFTIKRGLSLDRRQGGGILCSGNVSPSIDACIVESCSALRRGGGICCNAGATPTIQDCRIESNRAVNAGGGIACVGNSHAIILRCEIIENSASAYGGGIVTEEVRLHGSITAISCIMRSKVLLGPGAVGFGVTTNPRRS